ncbi:MAG: hypothetical protein ABIB65_05125 [Candidatus Margulisiibacteriota bacterium]
MIFFSFSVFAEEAETLSDDQLKIQKIQLEIDRLEKKLEITRTETRKARIQALIDGHKATLQKLTGGSDQTGGAPAVKLENVSVKVIMTRQDPAYFLAGAGIGGGAFVMSGGYVQSIVPGIGLLLDTGVGIGNEFNIIKAGIGTVHKFSLDNPYYFGVNILVTSFTRNVANVPGRGNVDRGLHLGAGCFVGSTVGPVYMQMGYNTCLGITGSLGYKIVK